MERLIDGEIVVISPEEEVLILAEWATNELNTLRLQKKAAVRSAFIAESESPVLINGVAFHGGFDSALKLDGAKRLAELAGLSEVTFFDIDNLPHVLTIAEAAAIVLQIAGKYQMDFATKQSALVQIDNATTLTELETI